MRLWHKDLIEVLPRQQLLGQWRECCLIAKNISELGTPNHILVNKIMDYPLIEFQWYGCYVCQEMTRRGYKCDWMKFQKYFHATTMEITKDKLFKNWHNDKYLTQCYFNLQEKYDCGGVTEEEWAKIAQKYNLRYTKKV